MVSHCGPVYTLRNEKGEKLSHDLAYTYMLGIYGKEHGIAKRHVCCGTTTEKWKPCLSTPKWTQTALFRCVVEHRSAIKKKTESSRSQNRDP